MNDFRKRILGPAAIPLVAFAFIGALAYAVSRILLAVTTEGSVVVATVMAACILFGAGAVAKSGTVKGMQRIALIAFTLMLFGGGIAVEASLGPREVEGHVEVVEEPVIAENIAFEPTEVHVPADEEFGLQFENRDAGVQHNIAVFRDPQFQDNVFNGAIFTGVATRTYELPALPTGAYPFWCSVHPVQMRGIVLAGEVEAPPPLPGGSPSPGAGSPSPGVGSPSPGTGDAEPTALDLVARNIAFDETELTFPAGSAVTMTFRNEDTLPHNWALYSDANHAPPALFAGEIFSGPAERRYQFTAPATPGTYYFRCDVHTREMQGTVLVT